MTTEHAIERIREIVESHRIGLGAWKDPEYCMGAIDAVLEMI